MVTVENWIPTTGGKLRAICQECGNKSRPLSRRRDGHPAIAELAYGWSCAPYPMTHMHVDGSVGSRFRCPDCRRATA
jgi:hypothetical protein